MLAAAIVSSADDSSGTSATWIAPLNSVKTPRTFDTIRCRPSKPTRECPTSNCHLPATGNACPAYVRVPSAIAIAAPPKSLRIHWLQMQLHGILLGDSCVVNYLRIECAHGRRDGAAPRGMAHLHHRARGRDWPDRARHGRGGG